MLKQTYEKWGSLLNTCGRDIILNISAYKFRDWNPEICHMSRTTLDIGAKVNGGAHFDYTEKRRNFLSVMAVAEQNSEAAEYGGNGYWNDPDMMVIGNPGLTLEEQKIHFALWCIMSSPLFLGNDPGNMNQEEKGIITNELAISINQDSTEQGKRVGTYGTTEVWLKRLINGNSSILLFNRDIKNKHHITLPLQEIGISQNGKIVNVFSGEVIEFNSGSIITELEPHTGLFLLVYK